MKNDAPKLDELLSRQPTRILAQDEIGAEFALIRRAFVEAGKQVPDAETFGRVGRASGTHLLKLISPRAPTEQCVLRFPARNNNRRPSLFPSLDAKMAPIAKLVFRPWEVAGHLPLALADHILNPDVLSCTVTSGFIDAFGREAFEALTTALTMPMPRATALPAAEFPIIFIPKPGGGDLQVTPLAPAEAYVHMTKVTTPYFLKSVEGQPPVPRGRWHRQFVADKPQNISSEVGKTRIRLLAKMPPVLDGSTAELYRYAHGGRFPRWRDPSIADAVGAYARLLDLDQSNKDIRAGRDRRADALITAARDFINEIVDETRAAHPECTLAPPPSVATVLLDRYWPTDGFDQARRGLTSDHFKARLKAASEA